MTTTLKDQHWLELITQCRKSGLTDQQWCAQNNIPASTFYYHVRSLRKKACEIPQPANSAVQKQDIVQIDLTEETNPPIRTASAVPAVCLEMKGIRIEIHEQAGAEVIRNTLSALQVLC